MIQNHARILAGTGTEVAGAGGLWFALDRLLGIPSTRLEPDQLTAALLTKYTVLFVPDGERLRLKGANLEAVREWVREGGHVVLIGGGVAIRDAIVSQEFDPEPSAPTAVVSQVDGVILDATVSGNDYWSKAIGRKSIAVFQNDTFGRLPADRFLSSARKFCFRDISSLRIGSGWTGKRYWGNRKSDRAR